MRSADERVLSLVLVAVVLMSAVGLAASQTFVNKTGKTVTGIRITFSKRVMVTRHDSAFPDQSPRGRSDQFTFSGRDLRNLGRFSITWMPSSAKVKDYEWIEKAQPAQATQGTSPSSEQEFTLPDPNTPPILYGNDYPGPDEPLYQPKPDEQIWLTDADGHEDIYDNDSIKINYAPGFDKSQITKINVYRNGMVMRFLPDTFDVLTNAQMQTFDGNPLEHSPASSHTDHAIMGYEYEFKILSAGHAWIMKKTVKSGFRWWPKEVWAEINSNWPDFLVKLSYCDMVAFFKVLKHDGFTGVCLDMRYYMDTPYDNRVYVLPTRDPSVMMWNNRTASDEELKTALKAINEAGVEAQVRSMIYISHEYQSGNRIITENHIKPSNPALFFQNHGDMMLALARILEEYNVKVFTVYEDPEQLEEYAYLLQKKYDRITRVFSGELGLDEANNNMLNNLFGEEPPDPERFGEIAGKFWGWIDAYGRPMIREYSCWAIPMDTSKDQRASVMTGKFVKFWKYATDYYRRVFSRNEEMFGEQGVYDADGVCLGGNKYWNMQEKKVLDNQEAADVWYGYLKGDQELGIDRINIWSLPLGDFWYGYDVGDFMICFDSPMYRVITSIIAP